MMMTTGTARPDDGWRLEPLTSDSAHSLNSLERDVREVYHSAKNDHQDRAKGGSEASHPKDENDESHKSFAVEPPEDVATNDSTNDSKDEPSPDTASVAGTSLTFKRALIAVFVPVTILLAVGVWLLVRFTVQPPPETMAPTMAPTGFHLPTYLETVLGSDLPALDDLDDPATLRETYGNKLSLLHDATQLARYLVANEIFDATKTGHGYRWGQYSHDVDENGNPIYIDVPVEEGAYTPPSSPFGTQLFSSFGTNNQEETMDRQDAIKVDASGDYLYMVEDDAVVVLSINTEQETDRVVLPMTSMTDAYYPTINGRETLRELGARDWIYDNATTTTSGLLLYQENNAPKLAVLVTGDYQLPSEQDKVVSSEDFNDQFGFLHEPALLRQGTRVVGYAIRSDGRLTLESVQDLPGTCADAYSTQAGTLHVVTHTIVNKWRLLLEPILKGYALTDNADYVERAVERSLEQTIPPFAEKLTQELQQLGLSQTLTKFWRPTQQTLAGAADESHPMYDSFQPLRGDYACRLTSVHSLGGTVAGTGIKQSSVTTVPTFGYYVNVYAHHNALVLADERFLPDAPYKARTTLTVIGLDDHHSRLRGYASAPGSLLDSYSLDFYSEGGTDYLRVATTEFHEEVWWAVDEWTEEETTNTVHVFAFGNDDDSNAAALTRIGHVDMGKPREEFKSVRFLDTVAYAVTFDTTDPFYVIDLSTPEAPTVMGELAVTGFSRYLHPIGNRRVVGVGEERDNSGKYIGVQVSVFDISLPFAPALLDRIVLANQYLWENPDYDADQSLDPRSFRFVPGRGGGVVTLPTQWWDRITDIDHQQFHAFSVTEDGLESLAVVDHLLPGDPYDWWDCDPVNTPRSFFFNDNNTNDHKLVTFMGTKIVATNLRTLEQRTIDEQYCHGYFDDPYH